MTEPGKLHKIGYSNKEHVSLPVTINYLKGYIEYKDRSPELREANALYYLYKNCYIHAAPYEQLVGRIEFKEPVSFNIGSATHIADHLFEEYKNQENLSDDEYAELLALKEEVAKRKYGYYWDRVIKKYHPGTYNAEQSASIEAAAATSTFFGGHMVLDYENLLTFGLNKYLDDINRYSMTVDAENPEFYDAMTLTLIALRILIERTADICENFNLPHMTALAEDLRFITENAPKSFRQALELMWFAHICNDSDTFGRSDQYLYPFYKNDIDNGVITREYAQTLIESLIIKTDEQGFIQNMTLGGIKATGEPAYNELTELILKTTAELGYKGPNLCLRINDIMPEKYWQLIIDCLSTGQGLPALYNDNVMIKYLNGMGVPQNEANDFCLAGCSQVMIPGKSQFVNDIGMVNLLKILEITYYNGIDEYHSKALCGLQTGEADGFETFEQFLDAFKKQIVYFARLEAEINNIDIDLRHKYEGYTLRSLLTRDCLENGKGVFAGGARYNSVQLECLGITNAADSLMTIKKLVFEDKVLKFSELIDIMRNDYKNNDQLRTYIINRIPKFGNDNEETDNLRREITQFLFDELYKQKGILGGFYIPGEVIFIAHDGYGKSTGATPDGRLAGTVLCDSAGASQGMDKKGPTALLNSVLKIPVDKPVTTIVLNIKFTKSVFKSQTIKTIQLLKSFFGQGGQQVQINVCDSEILKKAYDNPAEYSSLVVRVGGYSDYFVNLSRPLQAEIMERSEY